MGLAGNSEFPHSERIAPLPPPYRLRESRENVADCSDRGLLMPVEGRTVDNLANRMSFFQAPHRHHHPRHGQHAGDVSELSSPRETRGSSRVCAPASDINWGRPPGTVRSMDFVLSTGQTLAADRHGAADAPMVVLLHGVSAIAGGTRLWSTTSLALAGSRPGNCRY